MWAGRRCSVAPKVTLDRVMCKAHMDPIDAGTEPKEPAERKHERSWTPIEVDPHRWVGKGLPAEVKQMMTEGVRVDGPLLLERFEIPQYKRAKEEAASRQIALCA